MGAPFDAGSIISTLTMDASGYAGGLNAGIRDAKSFSSQTTAILKDATERQKQIMATVRGRADGNRDLEIMKRRYEREAAEAQKIRQVNRTGEEQQIRDVMAMKMRSMQQEAREARVVAEANRRLFGDVAASPTTNPGKHGGTAPESPETVGGYADLLSQMNAEMGKRSLLGKTMKLMMGGGVIGGLAMAANEVAAGINGIANAMNGLASGTLTLDQMQEKMLSSIPIAGSLGASIRNLWDAAFIGNAAATVRINEENSALEAMNGLLEHQIALKKRLSNEGANAGLSDFIRLSGTLGLRTDAAAEALRKQEAQQKLKTDLHDNKSNDAVKAVEAQIKAAKDRNAADAKALADAQYFGMQSHSANMAKLKYDASSLDVRNMEAQKRGLIAAGEKAIKDEFLRSEFRASVQFHADKAGDYLRKQWDDVQRDVTAKQAEQFMLQKEMHQEAFMERYQMEKEAADQRLQLELDTQKRVFDLETQRKKLGKTSVEQSLIDLRNSDFGQDQMAKQAEAIKATEKARDELARSMRSLGRINTGDSLTDYAEAMRQLQGMFGRGQISEGKFHELRLDQQENLWGSLTEQANQIRESTMRPYEKLKEKLQKLDTLRSAGLIDDKTYLRGVDEAKKVLVPYNNQLPTAIRAGSYEHMQYNYRQTVGSHDRDVANQQLKELQRISKSTDEMSKKKTPQVADITGGGVI